MTTEDSMDYKAKYEEALKRADAAINIAADKDLVKGVATTIFPELRESEDERMMRSIIEGFKHYDHTASKWNNIPVGDIIAYLEKVKEQYLTDDLPKWEKVDTDRVYPCGITREYDQNGDYVYSISSGKIWDGCEYIPLADLEKLPKKKEL